MSLLQGLLGFGAGAAQSLAETKKADMAQQRELNLAKLKAQYQNEATAQATAAEIASRRELLNSPDREAARREALARGETEIAEFLAPPEAEEPTSTMRNRQNAIEILVNQGFDRETAELMVLNQLRVTPNPVTGELSLIRPTPSGVSARSIEVTAETPEIEEQIPPRVSPEDLGFDPGEAVGVFAVGKQLWNKTVGQFNFAPTFLGPEEAAQNIRIIQRDLIKALSSSSKPPVIEQERIESLIPQPNMFFSNPEIANLQMASIVDLLGTQRRDDLRTLAQPNLNATLKRELQKRVNETEAIIGRILKPEAAQEFLSYGVTVDNNVSLDQESEIDTYRQIFNIERSKGQIPTVPDFLLTPYATDPDTFFNRVRVLGFKSGDRFNYLGTPYEVPRR